MTTRMLLLMLASAIGAAALSLLVWFAGPLVAIGSVHPFDPLWVRLSLVLLILAITGGAIGLAILKRRKAQAQLEKSLGETDETIEETGDGAVLGERMKDALATLRKTGSAHGDYLYDLPWYVIIGPPGAGKTTALVNAGLKFPLARGLSPAAIAGVGGTRYCDWWFTEEAVLLDTAGRYTTQDSDAKGDAKSWRSFLTLLRENRPRQPINGVLLCISLEDVITGGPALVQQHADAIRARLIELHDELKVDFPVYALFTKADLVAGFSEFFGHLNETGRKAVWGATFQTDDKTENRVGEVGEEFDLLIERLNLDMMDRLQDEPTPASKVKLLGFPSQMAASKGAITDFLSRIFEPTRYHANATLRGFYFTSGTQQGTPIDRLIGALNRSFGTEDRADAGYSGTGKSYFLTDLITRVIVGEAGWVSTNRAAVRRMSIARMAAYAALALVTFGALTAWWISYSRNDGLIGATFQNATRYKQIGEDISAETIISDGDLSRPLRHLQHLRALPGGYAERDMATPTAETFGLSQRERLNSAAETAYHNALERHFRPRLIYRLETELRARAQDAGYAFQALPAYLMLGGREAMDKAKLKTFLQADWEQNLFPGAANADGRRVLTEHLDAMLSFDPPVAERAVALDDVLIQETQKTLGRLGIVERGFELMRGFAAQQATRDWNAKAKAGQDGERVFEAQGGEGLESVRVPFLFTYDGFHEIFLGRLAEVRGIVEKDRKLLGAVADQATLQRQFDEFEPAMLQRYNAEFIRTWEKSLARLSIKALTADRPRYVALDAAARATSPLIALFESIKLETQLTREKPKPAGSTPPPAPAKLPFPPGMVPGAEIEAAFRPMHVVVEAQGGRKIIDDVITNLSDIHKSLMAMQDPAQAVGASQMFRTHLQSLSGNTTRLPPPFSVLLQRAANAFDQDATGSTVARLNRALAEQVTEVCRAATTGKYPFVKGAAAEITVPDFERLFATNGVIDRFFQVNLAPYADTTKREWVWNPTSPVGRQLSPAVLRDFQRAAAIRETYLRTGAAGFAFVARNMTIPAGASQVRLEVNGAIVATDALEGAQPPSPFQSIFGAPTPPPAPQKAPVAPTQMQWPGPAGLQKTAVIVRDFTGRESVTRKDGPWGFFRLMDGASVQRAGETVMARFQTSGGEVAYALNAPAGINPITSTILREFRCPGAQ